MLCGILEDTLSLFEYLLDIPAVWPALSLLDVNDPPTGNVFPEIFNFIKMLYKYLCFSGYYSITIYISVDIFEMLWSCKIVIIDDVV